MLVKNSRRIFVSGGLAVACAFLIAFVAESSSPSPTNASWRRRPIQLGKPGLVTMPRAVRGGIVSFARNVESGALPAVYIQDTDGRPVRTIALGAVTNLAAARLEDASIDASGNVVVAGTYAAAPDASERLHRFVAFPGALNGAATAADGSRQMPPGLSNFVARIDRAGQLVQHIDTGDYTPERICLVDDGSFWTLGQRWPVEASIGRADYQLLRQYDAYGQVGATYLNRDVLARSETVNYHGGGGGAASAFLECGAGWAVAYAARYPMGTGYALVRVNSTEHTLTVTDIRSPRGLVITGFIATGPDQIFASFGNQVPAQAEASRPADATHLPWIYWRRFGPRKRFAEPAGVFAVSSGVGGPSWRQVLASSPSDPITALIGTDHGSLVHVDVDRKMPRVAGSPRIGLLEWTRF